LKKEKKKKKKKKKKPKCFGGYEKSTKFAAEKYKTTKTTFNNTKN